jgi:hypothetical protein
MEMEVEQPNQDQDGDAAEVVFAAESVVAGMEVPLQALRELLLWPVLYAEEARTLGLRWPKGLLLYGPPGTGKVLKSFFLCPDSSSFACLGQRWHDPKVEISFDCECWSFADKLGPCNGSRMQSSFYFPQVLYPPPQELPQHDWHFLHIGIHTASATREKLQISL